MRLEQVAQQYQVLAHLVMMEMLQCFLQFQAQAVVAVVIHLLLHQMALVVQAAQAVVVLLQVELVVRVEQEIRHQLLQFKVTQVVQTLVRITAAQAVVEQVRLV